MDICDDYEEGLAYMYEEDADADLNSGYYDSSVKDSITGEISYEKDMRILTEDLNEKGIC